MPLPTSACSRARPSSSRPAAGPWRAMRRTGRRPPMLRDGERVDYGHVGDVAAVDPGVIETLLDAHLVPVVAPLSADDSGALLNVNADTVASHLAVALGAEKLILLTGAPGILE